MHVEKVKITKENKFGDHYTIETERLVYDNDRERLDAQIYNREHRDTYTDHYRRQMNSVLQVNTNQICDAIDEFLSMVDNLN